MFTPCRGVLGLAHLQEHTLAVVFLIRASCFQGRLSAKTSTRSRSQSPEDSRLKMGSEKIKSKQQIGVQIVLLLLRVRQRFPRRTRPATAADLCRLHAGLEHHFNLRFSRRMKCEDVYANIENEFLPILQLLTGTCMCRI